MKTISISLASALKLKNRLAGELAKLQEVVSAGNLRTFVSVNAILQNQSCDKVDVKAAYQQIFTVSKNLTAVKAAISVANSSIAKKLAYLSEQKSLLAFFTALQTERDTVVNVASGVDKITKIEYAAMALNSVQKQALCKDIQDDIEATQDEIDFYNATTKVIIDLEQ